MPDVNPCDCGRSKRSTAKTCSVCYFAAIAQQAAIKGNQTRNTCPSCGKDILPGSALCDLCRRKKKSAESGPKRRNGHSVSERVHHA